MLVITGFMGSGKTSVGKLLAKNMGYVFVDTDAEIEKLEMTSISDIFKINSEEYFRQRELEVLSRKFNDNTIMSVGGGTDVSIIRDSSLVVFIDTPLDIIKNRLSKVEIEKRPLFKNYELYDKRRGGYISNADIVVDGTISIEHIVDKILKYINRR